MTKKNIVDNFSCKLNNLSILAPPSYEECVHGSSMISDHNEQGMHGPSVQFAPKYPVYKFPMPMPCKCVDRTYPLK